MVKGASLLAKSVEKKQGEASAAVKIIGSDPYKEPKMPEYYPIYPLMVEFMDTIKIHAVKGVFPDKLFKKRSPNQSAEELQYIRENYKQVTLPVFMDLMSTISRAFNDNNWSISYGEDHEAFKDKSFQYYVEHLPIYGSLENWLKFMLPSIKMIDANGIIAIKPRHIPTIEHGGDLIIDPQSLMEPVPYYYSSAQLVGYEDGEYSLVELEEKSIVSHGNAKARIGRCYEFYDRNVIWKINQVGKYTDNNFEAIIYFTHNWDKVPVIKLKGVPRIEKNEVLYQSQFLFATDLLDLVAMNSSYLQASINKCVYPYRVMVGDVCDFEESGIRCDQGMIMDVDTQKAHACPRCHGSGLLSRVSPLGELLLRPGSRENQEGDSIFTNPMQYVSPSTETLTYLDGKIEKDEYKARSILHLYTSGSNVKGGEDVTATGKAIDLKALYAFVQTISDQIFDIYEFALSAIGYMRYGNSFAAPTVVYPKSFDLETEQDLMLKISEAIKAGLPPFVIHSIVFRYLQSVFYTDKKTGDVYNLIISSDRLLTYTEDDIALKMARGTVDKWEEILHTSAVSFVSELILEDEKFFELELTDQKQKLIEKAKAKAAEIQPKNSQQTGIMNDILGGGSDIDTLGKIPLALQQMALARERAITAGDTSLANNLGAKMRELTKDI